VSSRRLVELLSSNRSRRQLAELLRVQARLTLREPYAIGMGVGLPIILLVVFGLIGKAQPGKVAGSGFTIIDLWMPTLLVVSLIGIAGSLPTTMVRDREIGWLRRVSTTPLHPSLLLAAQLIFDLVLAASAVLILSVGGSVVFAATLHVQILPFAVSLLLAVADIFALGLVMVALAPNQTAAQVMGGVAFFGLMFLSGLWVNPVQVGEPLKTIMYYSPSGAAAKALLDSAFNGTPPSASLATMAVYTIVFGFIAIRYFRWE
jgi:ABC-2 type transport system permease protein